MRATLVLCDDCGEKGQEHSVSLDGKTYSLDLCPACWKKHTSALVTLASPGKRAYSGSGRSKEELAAIRAWAKSKKMPVGEKGRINKTILDAYDAAH